MRNSRNGASLINVRAAVSGGLPLDIIAEAQPRPTPRLCRAGLGAADAATCVGSGGTARPGRLPIEPSGARQRRHQPFLARYGSARRRSSPPRATGSLSSSRRHPNHHGGRHATCTQFEGSTWSVFHAPPGHAGGGLRRGDARFVDGPGHGAGRNGTRQLNGGSHRLEFRQLCGRDFPASGQPGNIAQFPTAMSRQNRRRGMLPTTMRPSLLGRQVGVCKSR